MNKNTRAFIVGNGKSREQVDLSSLRPFGTIYGCNALYRTFEPDFLIAIDPMMIKEIKKSNFPKEKFIVPPSAEHYEPAECNRYQPRSNAGMNAILEAIKHGKKDLLCFGFDFIWTDKNKSISNIFDGSPNYAGDMKASYTDNEGRIRYLTWIATKYKDVKIWLVYPEAYFDSLEFRTIPASNVNGLTFGKLREILNQ